MAITLLEDIVNRFIVNSPADHTVEEYSGNTNVSAINSVLVYSRKENVKVFARVTATQVWETLGVVGNDLDSVSGHGTEYRKDAVFNVTTMDRVSIISLGAETTARIVFNPSLPTEGLENAGALTSMGGTMTAHILPDTNAIYDLGSAEKKIRHLFLSDNSLWVGDEHKVSISGGKMKFRKRKKSTVPAAVAAASGDEGAALAHAGVATLADMKLEHWREFMRTLPGQGAAEIKDIFRDNSEDYEDDFEAGAASGGSTATQTIVSDMAQNQITTLAIASGTTPIVQVYEDVVIAAGDNVELDVLRLHLDSDLTDSSDSGHTVTANGNAAISTSDKKFGNGSVYLDGNAGNYLTIPDSDDWDFGTDPFTIEMWINSSTKQGDGVFIAGGDPSSDGANNVWFIKRNANGDNLNFGYWNGSYQEVNYPVTWNNNTWYHIAIVRDGADVRYYWHGALVGTWNIGASVQLNTGAQGLIVGSRWSLTGAGIQPFNGYIDDLRITKGLARYTANFSVPMEAHSDVSVGSTKTFNKTNDYEIEHASDTTVEVKKTSAGSADVKIRLI